MALLALLLAVIALLLYLLPGIVATKKRSKAEGGIWILNIFLGWTLAGWVVALAWAVISAVDEDADPDLMKCPHCAEFVRREARICKHCGSALPERR